MKISPSDNSVRDWLKWQPHEPITANPAEIKPSKPSKPGFVGFEGSISADSPIIGESDLRSKHAVQSAPDVRQGTLDCAPEPERVMSWAQWKAGALNRLFLEQGTLGQLGRITAETVLHGEQLRRGQPTRQEDVNGGGL